MFHPRGCSARKAEMPRRRSSRVPLLSITTSAILRCSSVDNCASIFCRASSSDKLLRAMSRASCTLGATTTTSTAEMHKRRRIGNFSNNGMSNTIMRWPLKMSNSVCQAIRCIIGRWLARLSANIFVLSLKTSAPTFCLSITPLSSRMSVPSAATTLRCVRPPFSCRSSWVTLSASTTGHFAAIKQSVTADFPDAMGPVIPRILTIAAPSPSHPWATAKRLRLGPAIHA
mmetsp:Transcript_47675/g.132678  ORF Transcript_47675/g.132678 Transcript_47675/m.132678 type:complete len:229 (+) Transcript_47675:137-823(+)